MGAGVRVIKPVRISFRETSPNLFESDLTYVHVDISSLAFCVPTEVISEGPTALREFIADKVANFIRTTVA